MSSFEASTLPGHSAGELEPWDAEGAGLLADDAECYRTFDLEERTTKFAEAVIDFLKPIPEGPKTNRLIDQLLGASSSTAANYCEADDSMTRKEFRHRIGICRRESRESKLHLRLLARSHEPCKPEARTLWQEARELNLIFSSILRRTAPDPLP
jgi:four helix bundle protein